MATRLEKSLTLFPNWLLTTVFFRSLTDQLVATLMTRCLQIYLGGVDTFNKNGLTSRYNFNGCIDFVRFNGIHMIRDAKNAGVNGRFTTTGPVAFGCSVSRPLTCSVFSSCAVLALQQRVVTLTCRLTYAPV